MAKENGVPILVVLVVKSAGDLAIDEDGDIYISGDTQSSVGIATEGAHQENPASTSVPDVFLVKFSKDGEQEWGSYFGGTGFETGFAILVTPEKEVFIAGSTGSASGISTDDTHQTVYGQGEVDGFLAKFTLCEGPGLDVLNGGYQCQNNAFTFDFNFTGNPPFTVIYEIDGTVIDSVITNQNPFFLSFEEGSYQDSIVITKVKDKLCEGTITGIPFLKVVERLSASPAETFCQEDGTYMVSFDLMGGMEGYIPNPITDGTIDENRFTSRPVNVGEDFAFLITTGLGCDAINVSGRSPGCPVLCPDLNLNIDAVSNACTGESLTMQAGSFSTYRCLDLIFQFCVLHRLLYLRSPLAIVDFINLLFETIKDAAIRQLLI